MLIALVCQIGLPQLEVSDYQPKVVLGVVEHEQLVEGQLLDPEVDQFLSGCLLSCRPEFV